MVHRGGVLFHGCAILCPAPVGWWLELEKDKGGNTEKQASASLVNVNLKVDQVFLCQIPPSSLSIQLYTPQCVGRLKDELQT